MAVKLIRGDKVMLKPWGKLTKEDGVYTSVGSVDNEFVFGIPKRRYEELSGSGVWLTVIYVTQNGQNFSVQGSSFSLNKKWVRRVRRRARILGR